MILTSLQFVSQSPVGRTINRYMSYRWHKVDGEWDSFHWRKFCIATVVVYGLYFLGWILVSFLVTGRWDHRIFEGAASAICGLLITISWQRFRSTESPDFASERKAALRGKTESPVDAIDLSEVLRIASLARSTVFTVINFVYVYDVDPKTGRGRHADLPWHTLWLYAGRITDDYGDDKCGSNNECWVNKYATQLEGRWYDHRNANAAAGRVAAALRQAGYETDAEFFGW